MGTLILFYSLFFTPICVLLWTVINDAELCGVSVVNMTVLNYCPSPRGFPFILPKCEAPQWAGNHIIVSIQKFPVM